MKKITKTFTFWFLIIGLVVITLNLLNMDDLNLLMIGLNPILNMLSSSKLCGYIADVPYLWHILSLITVIGYGVIIDLIRKMVKKI